MTTITLTSGTSWTVPSDWNSYDNTITVYSAGGGGGGGRFDFSPEAGGNGGNGAINSVSNVVLTPGSSVSIGIGSSGIGGTGGVLEDGQAGTSGGATNFGAYVSALGGGGGQPGTSGGSGAHGTPSGSGVSGGTGGYGSSSGGNGQNGYIQIVYTPRAYGSTSVAIIG